MGRKAKYTKEQKIQACEDYISGRKSAAEIVADLNISKRGDNSGIYQGSFKN